MMPKAAPYPGRIRPGDSGIEVAAIQTALRRWGADRGGKSPAVRRYKATGKWAAPTTFQLKYFLKRQGLEWQGFVGPHAWAELEPWMTDYAREKLNEQADIKRESARRLNLASIARKLAALDLVYSGPGSPTINLRMQTVREGRRAIVRGLHEDCSSLVTACYFVAGLPDPNGLSYPGFGFTGTLITRGRRVSAATCKAGDLVFYGRSSVPSHVAIAVGNGQVISFGSEPVVRLLPYNYRADVLYAHDYLS